MNNVMLEIGEALEKAQFCHQNNMPFSAMLLWEKIVAIQPTENRLFRYADSLRLCGRYSKAEEVFQLVAVSNIPPKYQYLYYLYLGQLYMDIGDIAKAKSNFLTCLKYENCDTVPYIFIASLLKEEKYNDEAIYYLTLALQKDGDIDEVYYNLAYRLAIKTDFLGALDAVNKCLSLNPQYPNAVALRGDLNTFLLSKEVIVV